jgi:transcriptional regulator with XRE-family HTH domain
MVERGKRDPTLQYLRRFANLVDVPLAVLFWEPGGTSKQDRKTEALKSKIAALMAQFAAALGVEPQGRQGTSNGNR